MILTLEVNGQILAGRLDLQKARIKRPGSRGGKYYIDKQGNIIYGTRNLGHQSSLFDEPESKPEPKKKVEPKKQVTLSGNAETVKKETAEQKQKRVEAAGQKKQVDHEKEYQQAKAKQGKKVVTTRELAKKKATHQAAVKREAAGQSGMFGDTAGQQGGLFGGKEESKESKESEIKPLNELTTNIPLTFKGYANEKYGVNSMKDYRVKVDKFVLSYEDAEGNEYRKTLEFPVKYKMNFEKVRSFVPKTLKPNESKTPIADTAKKVAEAVESKNTKQQKMEHAINRGTSGSGNPPIFDFMELKSNDATELRKKLNVYSTVGLSGTMTGVVNKILKNNNDFVKIGNKEAGKILKDRKGFDIKYDSNTEKYLVKFDNLAWIERLYDGTYTLFIGNPQHINPNDVDLPF